MAIPMQNAQALIEKIQLLPTDRLAEVEDFVDFLNQRSGYKKANTDRQSLNFPVMSVGKWPDELSLSRADIYGNNGR